MSKIILDQNDLEDAVKCYIEKMGLNQQIEDIDFKAKRGDDSNKLSVTVSLVSEGQMTLPIFEETTKDPSSTNPFVETAEETAKVETGA